MRWYPGSPAIIAHYLRPGDRFVACDRHPAEAAALEAFLSAAHRTEKPRPAVRAEARDGYEALRAMLPPAARRGLILIDPPFEVPGEFDRLAQCLEDGFRRFATGIFALWFPIKDHAGLRVFTARALGAGFDKTLIAELSVKAAADGTMSGSGLFIANPPFGLSGALAEALPFLAETLTPHHDAGAGAGWRLNEQEGARVIVDRRAGDTRWL